MSPVINWDNVPDATEFEVLPAGDYHVAVKEIDATQTTEAGDELWNMTLEVIDGPHRGAKVWDNVSFGAKAIKRAKLVIGRLGFDLKGTLAVTPPLLIGATCILTIEHEPARDRDGTPKMDAEGRPKMKAKVPFAGYKAWAPGQAPAAQPVPAATFAPTSAPHVAQPPAGTPPAAAQKSLVW